ncbi:hypothetical protein [Streptococcus gallolyticus]|uniref:hypothetical protein n=1 Tax=Streptococcus gallolyticus TaxID=315405 RepID=UPI002283AA8C|nr:hypothetical protein [Streptococcus gallolyticus]MCY7193400.1 hypothetical protein [Streptococcus gallolyticus subsp. gallolyticus]
MKVNVFKFTDTKTGETFTGSIEDYYKHLNITKTALQSRMRRKRISREWLGYKDNGKDKDRKSDSKTKRTLNKYYLERAIAMGI